MTATVAERKAHALELFADLPKYYDEVAALFSFGQDPLWRQTLVNAVQASPQDRVLDVATGTGMISAKLVRRYGCSVVGLDQSEQMLGRARARLDADPQLAARIELVQGEAERIPFADGEFDAVTFAYLLRYVGDPAQTVRELARVVKPGGRIASLDFAVPSDAIAHALWVFYTRMGLPTLGRVVSKGWYDVGRFLGPNISGFYERYPVDRLGRIWAEAGIGSIRMRRMSLGGGLVMWGVKNEER
jgi:demethylmenaquinone methyltransferase/2-methoxy-6-polyprenyl-1,4-benzoquinol methylase